MLTGFHPTAWSLSLHAAAPVRAARVRGRARCRTPRGRRACGTARARAPASSRVTRPELVTVPSLDFSTSTWRSANAATCGRWVTDEHLGVLGERGEAAADLDRGGAADAGVHLVEDERRAPGWCRRGRPRSASITRDSSPPEAPLCSGRGSEPDVGREQELDVVEPAAAEAHPARPPPGPRRPGGCSVSAGASTVRGTTRMVTWACGIASRVSSSLTARRTASPAAATPRLAQRVRRPWRAPRAGGRSARPRAPGSARRSSRGRAAACDAVLGPGEHLVDASRRTCG